MKLSTRNVFFSSVFFFSSLISGQIQAAVLSKQSESPEKAVTTGSLNHRTIQHWETSNGAKVYFIETPELPMLDVELAFFAGSARDGQQSGVATLTAMNLDKGTGKSDANALADQFASLGAEFSEGVGTDLTVVGLRCLTESKKLMPSVNLFADVVAKPSFPSQAVQRQRESLLQALRQVGQQPSMIARQKFFRELYGKHPYAQPSIGTKKSVAQLNPTDLKKFHQKFYQAKNARLVLVGALNRSQAETIANRVTRDLPAGRQAEALPTVSKRAGSNAFAVSFPSHQTHVFMGELGVNRGDPDYVSLIVGNEVLGGGGLTSQLFQTVRKERGLVYSVHSGFTPFLAKGPFILNLQTRNEKAEEAIRVAKQTVMQFLKEGPHSKELGLAKRSLAGSILLGTSKNSGLARALMRIAVNDFPLNYYETLPKKIMAVTAKDVRTTFEKHLHPSHWLLVTAGPHPKKAAS